MARYVKESESVAEFMHIGAAVDDVSSVIGVVLDEFFMT